MQIRYFISAFVFMVTANAWAHDYAIGNIKVRHPWARATVPAQTSGGAFLSVENHGATDKLLSVSSPVAKSAELHSMVMEGFVMQMRKLNSVDIPTEQATVFSPGGFHIMLFNLKAPLKVGEKFPLKLKFEKAGEVTVHVYVEAMTAGTGSDAPK